MLEWSWKLGFLEASELLQRDVDDWLRRVPPNLEGLLYDSQFGKAPLRLGQEQSELQTVSLLRMLLKFSGDKLRAQQRRFETGDRDFTFSHNARLCGSVFGVNWSKPFGQFDPKAMHSALSRSVLVVPSGGNALVIPDTVDWKLRMMEAVPVGFPKDHLVW